METIVDTRGLPRTWMLAHRPEAAGEARKMAERTLAGWKVAPEIADPVLLVVSELVTNAVEHARPPLTLRLSRDAGTGRVRVEVTDGGPAATEGEWAASCGDEERGRGLDIVDRVAAAHGDHLETGHAIHWADLTTAAWPRSRGRLNPPGGVCRSARSRHG